MLAIKVSINGEERCVAGADGVLNLSTLIHGSNTPTEQQGASLIVDGTLAPLTAGTWLSEAVAAGDKIEIEIVEVDAQQITPPADIQTTSLEELQAQQEAFYQQMQGDRQAESDIAC